MERDSSSPFGDCQSRLGCKGTVVDGLGSLTRVDAGSIIYWNESCAVSLTVILPITNLKLVIGNLIALPFQQIADFQFLTE